MIAIDKLETEQTTLFKDIGELMGFLKPIVGSTSSNTSGICFDNSEGLNLLVNDNGYSVITSGKYIPEFVFRGQVTYFDDCRPTLYRDKKANGCFDLAEKLIELARATVFEEILELHPYIQLLKNNQKIKGYTKHKDPHIQQIANNLVKHPFFVNTQGILQHYGFSTNLLDTTSNLDVAAFFATSKIDEKLKRYIPTEHNESGVFYVINWANYIFLENKFEFVGWQPLTRPEQQRASSLKMSKTDNLNSMPYIFKYRFKHNIKSSMDIYSKFCIEEKNQLFEEDSINKVVSKIKIETEFDEAHLKKAYSKLLKYFPNYKVTYGILRGIIKGRGISIINDIDLKNKYIPEFENKDYVEDFAKIMKKTRLVYFGYV